MAKKGEVMVRRMTILLLSTLLAAGCATGGEEDDTMGKISGSVIYLERIALPPGAIVTVELRDVSMADAPAKMLGSTRFEAQGGPPYPFALSYDPEAIDERHSYALRATISSGDQLLFTTDTHHPAFTTEAHELRVRSVGGTIAGDANGPMAALGGREWLLIALGDESVDPLSDGRRPYIHFEASGRVHGFAGCNRFTGDYRLDDRDLSFARMAMTRMACAEGMNVEQRLSEALSKVTSYKIDDDRLILQDSAGEVVAVLQSDASAPARP